MTNDDHAISLTEFYAADLAHLRERMHAAGYILTLDALIDALERGDVRKFERLYATRYYQLARAVLTGQPDFDGAGEAHDRLLDKLLSGQLSWDAVDFRNFPLDLDDKKGETQ